ncbi:hypothetical protein Tco_0055370, partial [Tanacetum coccineum]
MCEPSHQVVGDEKGRPSEISQAPRCGLVSRLKIQKVKLQPMGQKRVKNRIKEDESEVSVDVSESVV